MEKKYKPRVITIFLSFLILGILMSGALCYLFGFNIYTTILPISIAFLCCLFKSFSFFFTDYYFYDDRIVIERGFIRRIIDQIEYFKITDIRVIKGLLQRIFGLSSIKIVSDDETVPVLWLENIPDISKEIWEKVKKDRRERGLIPLMEVSRE